MVQAVSNNAQNRGQTTFYFFLQHNMKSYSFGSKKISKNALKINVVCPLFPFKGLKI